MEQIIKNLCMEYEKLLNENKKGLFNVKFSNEKKIDGYWLPDSEKVGLTHTDVAWHSEIWVNNKCIFRQSLVPINNSVEEWDKVKRICQQRLITSVFTYGMAAARQILSTIDKTPTNLN